MTLLGQTQMSQVGEEAWEHGDRRVPGPSFLGPASHGGSGHHSWMKSTISPQQEACVEGTHTLLLTFFAYHSGVRQTDFPVRMEISVLTKQISDRILPYHSQM